MSNLRLHLPEPQVATPKPVQLPLGRYLVNQGIIDAQDLVHALELQCRFDACSATTTLAGSDNQLVRWI